MGERNPFTLFYMNINLHLFIFTYYNNPAGSRGEEREILVSTYLPRLTWAKNRNQFLLNFRINGTELNLYSILTINRTVPTTTSGARSRVESFQRQA